ncbi:hypothetical protein QBC39DRAFT_120550, partial [Podospora conica]
DSLESHKFTSLFPHQATPSLPFSSPTTSFPAVFTSQALPNPLVPPPSNLQQLERATMMFLTSFTFFLALGSASPTLKTSARSPLGDLVLAPRTAINDCDIGVYEDHTDDKSPWIEDCQYLADHLPQETVDLAMNGEYMQYNEYQSCAVGIQSYNCQDPNQLSCRLDIRRAKIGDEDIRGVLHNAIAIARRDGTAAGGKVGAIGWFNCQIEALNSWDKIKWSIFWNHEVRDRRPPSARSLPSSAEDVLPPSTRSLPPSARSPFGAISARTSINDCDNGVYEDHTADNSPWIHDCEILANNIANKKYGTTILPLNGQFIQYASYKSCAVGIQGADCSDNLDTFECHTNFMSVKVGNTDISDSIHSAIALANEKGTAASGRVGSIGYFDCQIELGLGKSEGRVKWSMYWNPYPESDPYAGSGP